jgi:sarcosine oxidase subunit gamma
VIAEAVRRGALADYTDRFAALSAANGRELLIRELPFVSQVNLRADSNDAASMQRLAAALGFALPAVPNTVTSRDDRRALWLGPDEWLIVGPDGQQDALERALRNGLDSAPGSIVDVSANRTLVEIHGERARELLAHGVSIDLDARSFGAGHCGQTLLAKAQVIIERRDASSFDLFVRASFATYVGAWLFDSAADPALSSGRSQSGHSGRQLGLGLTTAYDHG